MRSTSSRSRAMGPYRAVGVRITSVVPDSNRLMTLPQTRGPRAVFELSNLIELYRGEEIKSIVAPESAAAPAAFLFQPDALDGHGPVHRLAHVVDRKGGHAHGGQGLHLDAGPAEDASRGLDTQQSVLGEGEVHGDGVEGQGMAERDQLASPLGGHNASEPG